MVRRRQPRKVLADSLHESRQKSVAAVRRATAAATHTALSGRDRIRVSTKSAATTTSKVAEQVARLSASVRQRALSTIDVLRSAPAKIIDELITECPLPVFLLPTGSGPRDFVTALEFGHVMNELQSRRLIRPTMTVWVGRKDFDQDYLAEHLKDEFIRQFSEAREEVRQAFEADIEVLDSEAKRTSSRIEKPLRWTVAAGALAGVLFSVVAAPFAALVMLSIALFGAGRTFSAVGDYLASASAAKGKKKEMEQRFHELDSEFSIKSRVFRRAVKNLDVNVHPELQVLVKLFTEVDGVTFVPATLGGTEAEAPEVARYLRAPGFRERVPELYRPLLDTF